MEIKEVLNERIRLSLCYLLCAFSFAFGVGVTSESIIKGLLNFCLWISIFSIGVIIESIIRKD